MLPLANCFSNEHFFFEKAPRIRIQKITLGFNYSSSQRDEILKVLKEAMQEERQRRQQEYRSIRHSILWSDYFEATEGGFGKSERGEDIHDKIKSDTPPPLFEEYKEVEVEISNLKGQFRG